VVSDGNISKARHISFVSWLVQMSVELIVADYELDSRGSILAGIEKKTTFIFHEELLLVAISGTSAMERLPDIIISRFWNVIPNLSQCLTNLMHKICFTVSFVSRL
jgi:hypothetical protein